MISVSMVGSDRCDEDDIVDDDDSMCPASEFSEYLEIFFFIKKSRWKRQRQDMWAKLCFNPMYAR